MPISQVSTLVSMAQEGVYECLESLWTQVIDRPRDARRYHCPGGPLLLASGAELLLCGHRKHVGATNACSGGLARLKLGQVFHAHRHAAVLTESDRARRPASQSTLVAVHI